MALPAEERFLMGLRMFDSARTLVLASLSPGRSLSELRGELLERFYGRDLSAASRLEISARFRGLPQPRIAPS
ncbi:MAG: hypothetical protein V1929_00095 [bacterium]